MKRLFLLLLFPVYCFGQDQLPSKDGKVIFEQIDSIPNASRAELYTRSKIWMANIFKSSKDVLQIDDKDSGKIIGKGNFTYLYRVMGSGTEWTCDFTIQIDCRENKARIRLYDISAHAGGEATAEYFNEHHAKKHIQAINENSIGILENFKSSLSKKTDDSF